MTAVIYDFATKRQVTFIPSNDELQIMNTHVVGAVNAGIFNGCCAIVEHHDALITMMDAYKNFRGKTLNIRINFGNDGISSSTSWVE